MNNTDICNMALAYLAKGRSASCFMTIAEKVYCVNIAGALPRGLLGLQNWMLQILIGSMYMHIQKNVCVQDVFLMRKRL